MIHEQKEYLSVSLVFIVIAVLIAIVGLISGGCASWQSTARQAAFSASAVAKMASEEMPRLLSARCVKDTQACHHRDACIEAKASGGSIRDCCPEMSICDERAAKVQAALVGVNQAVYKTLQLVELSDESGARKVLWALSSLIETIRAIQQELQP